jgi:hypothetical protein
VARAETLDVKIPFHSSCTGRRCRRRLPLDTEGPVVLLRGEHGNKAGVVFTMVPARGQDPAGDAPVLTFTTRGNAVSPRHHLAVGHQGRQRS